MSMCGWSKWRGGASILDLPGDHHQHCWLLICTYSWVHVHVQIDHHTLCSHEGHYHLKNLIYMLISFYQCIAFTVFLLCHFWHFTLRIVGTVPLYWGPACKWQGHKQVTGAQKKWQGRKKTKFSFTNHLAAWIILVKKYWKLTLKKTNNFFTLLGNSFFSLPKCKLVL